jgi:aspartyl-tRNA(Asn)/glutamyl-tRNA(Gln) amidotransferase subunit B
MGYPGVLPRLSREALRMGCIVARALNCTIPKQTWFERKQYFYPDMTKNYQISQFASPLGQRGYLDIEGRGIKKRVRIHECHLEEDAGKMIHSGTVSLLDYNRAGVPLLEIVTEPDMETGEEAELFIQQLRRMLRYLEVCDGNMEEGSLRADANVSINLPGKGLGRKVEIKNLNSSRFVKLGLTYEIARQSALLDAGKTVIQETRLWNENRDETAPMRSKENAHDYRYFPEPDLPIFEPDSAFLESLTLGELPAARLARFIAEYGLTYEQADLITEEKQCADYFEKAVSAAHPLEKTTAAPLVAQWILSDLKHLLAQESLELNQINQGRLRAERLGSIVALIAQGTVSQKSAKQIIEHIRKEDRDPRAIIRDYGLEQISDLGQIDAAIEQVIAAEQATLAELRRTENDKRKRNLKAFLVGRVLAQTEGRADPKIVTARLNIHLTEGSE